MPASACVIVMLVALSSVADESATVSESIRWLCRTNHRHPMWFDGEARGRMAGWIAMSASESGIDPYLVTAMVFYESTFRPGVTGERGEVGLIQVARHVRLDCERDGLIMTDPIDQLRCGVRHLRKQIDRCGSLRGGLTAYGSAPPRCAEEHGDRVWRAVNARVAKMRRLRGRPWSEK